MLARDSIDAVGEVEMRISMMLLTRRGRETGMEGGNQ
jgi:hypothetical protein